jgi:hypothetical protein
MTIGQKQKRTLSEDELQIIAYLEKDRGRKLTPEEIHLSLEQAPAIGDLEGEPTHYIPLCGVIAEWKRERKRKSSK